VPDEPVELPPGTKYRVTLDPMPGDGEEAEEDHSLRQFLLGIAGTAKGDYPADLARNHDYYLHGRPKR